MTPPRWTAEAEDLKPNGSPGTLMGVGGAKAIPHVTVSGPGSFSAMRDVLTNKKAEPHYLYDFKSDRLGQFFPLDVSARALFNPGTLPGSPNKAGTRVIQIEFVSWPGTKDGLPRNGAPTTKGGMTASPDWNPGPNFRAMMRDIRANGVPDLFPFGATDPGTPRAPWGTYLNGSGWFPHSTVPGNVHWDTGTLNLTAFFAAASTTTTTPEEYDIMAVKTDQELLALIEKGVTAALWQKGIPGGDGLGGSSLRNNIVVGAGSAVAALGGIKALLAREGVDVDEQALAASLVPILGPLLQSTLAEILKQAPTGSTPDQIAGAVVDLLKERL